MLRRILPLTALLAALAVPALAQSKSPLPIEGKTSLFQRVLIRERIEAKPAPDSDGTAAALSPLQVFFVYDRDGDWMQIGASDQGDDLMWIPAAASIPWNQNIVATLEGSDNVGRVLFFNDIDPIYDIIESENPAGLAKDARDEALAAEQGGEPSETVIALGPRETIDQRQNLYVMPILSTEEAVFDIGPFVNLLQVAVASANAPNTPLPSDDAGAGDLKTAVVFVVDTTISMEPYIRATRDALQEVYREAAGSAAADAVSFGLVGYRDSLEAAPGLGYDVRTFVDLQEGLNVDNFLNGIDQMQEADSSSKNFREDSYHGIEHALEDMDWSGFGARFIVLVTDAGPREFDDQYSSTGLSAESLNRIIRERIGGAMAVMHLRTDRGAKDHPSAEAAYKQLTAFPNSAPLYFPIQNGDPEVYRETARTLGAIVAQQTSSYRRSGGDEILDEDAVSDEGDGRFSGLSTAGRTMQLAYLGKTEGARAPDLFEAYVADRDFDRTGLKPLSIRLLISKADLSNLEEALRIIVDQAERNVVNPDQFFAQVLGVAADMSRRPDQVSRQSDPSLAEAVALDEYLADLPYKSQIMAITEDDWVRLPISEQQTIVNGLYDKIERYRRYNESTDQWVDYLGAGPQAGNLLYPMLLDDLP
ncbi:MULTISPECIES: vWA domain-containing protein [unclassified Ruegeria]|uniref:vWA domain-containing protein n=1 Tax=unclassified Ruegeria TaxID=2625375 RepID=UPI0014886409|nr:MULTISPECIES: vWA domain-containing protein [unclassified Ruegeria]NOD64580.1 VWA domain-containing protein [Ruegeria sp. HKCCD6109]